MWRVISSFSHACDESVWIWHLVGSSSGLAKNFVLGKIFVGTPPIILFHVAIMIALSESLYEMKRDSKQNKNANV